MSSTSSDQHLPSVVVANLSVNYPIHLVGGLGIREHIAFLLRGGWRDRAAIPALRNISFNIGNGERVAILGRNGAGKSTLLRAVAGIITPTAGDVFINGEVHSLLSLGAGVDVDLSGVDNIVRICRLYDVERRKIKEIVEDVKDFSELGDALHRQVKTYSDGMRVRLLFSTYTAFDAKLLIMDEMLAAGDSEFLKKAQARAKAFYDAAAAVLIATHSTDFALNFCSRGIVLKSGAIEFDGPIQKAIDFYNQDNIVLNGI